MARPAPSNGRSTPARRALRRQLATAPGVARKGTGTRGVGSWGRRCCVSVPPRTGGAMHGTIADFRPRCHDVAASALRYTPTTSTSSTSQCRVAPPTHCRESLQTHRFSRSAGPDDVAVLTKTSTLCVAGLSAENGAAPERCSSPLAWVAPLFPGMRAISPVGATQRSRPRPG